MNIAEKKGKFLKESNKSRGVGCKAYYGSISYVIVDNPNVSWDDIMNKYVKHFTMQFVPKFGKYEIEDYIGNEMLKALLITKNITDLFNTDLVCDDSPFNVTNVDYKMIQTKLLPCFEVVSQESDKIELMFRWKYYDKLDK